MSRKVLKATLDELIKAEQKVQQHIDAAIYLGAWHKRETKKEHSRLCDKFYVISEDLSVQSGLSSLLYERLAEEIVRNELSNETLYTVVEQLGVEIVDKKWWFEGEIHRNANTGRYSLANGQEVYTLTAGESISVKIYKHSWTTSAFGYNKHGKGELQGWEGYKLDGLKARINLEYIGVSE